MIRLDLAFAIVFFAAVPAVLLTGIWLVSFCRDRRARKEDVLMQKVRQCPYCARIFTENAHQEIMVCPVCKSYVEEG